MPATFTLPLYLLRHPADSIPTEGAGKRNHPAYYYLIHFGTSVYTLEDRDVSDVGILRLY